MKPVNTRQVHPGRKTSPAPDPRKRLLRACIAAAVLVAAAASVYWGYRKVTAPEPGLARPTPAAEARARDFHGLLGDWVRTDFGYVISIRRIAPDGRAEAAYFNPKPIHVARAEASGAGETAKLFLELRDVGYPGSTYELVHDARNDLLAGLYFQAAIGRRFDVVFVRKN